MAKKSKSQKSCSLRYNNIAYPFKGNLYLNITNRCSMRCQYCIKYKWRWNFRGYDLRLNREPTVDEIIESVKKHKGFNEVVFCGYGEPLMRLKTIKAVSRKLKEMGYIVRINTNGHGNLIYKRNICPELKGLIDKISISLNAHDSKIYYKLHRPKYGRKTFNAVIEFIKECKKYIPEVIMTSVAFPEVDIKKCEEIANSLNVKFIKRPYLT